MRRMVLFVTVALVAAATIAAGAFPTYAEQAKAREQGRAVAAGTCTVEDGGSHETIQASVDDPSCQTIQLESPEVELYEESVTIDRNLTITGSGSSLTPIVSAPGKSVFTILSGNTATFEDFHIDSGGGAGVEQGGGILNRGTLHLNGMELRFNKADYGGGIYNQGTLTVEGGELYTNTASNDGGGIFNTGTLTLGGRLEVDSNVASGEGGGIFNTGTLYVCGATFSGNQAPPGTEDDISGTPAQQCPTQERRCTIFGTRGADTLLGTSRDDVICGRGGTDTLMGRGGDDVLRGGGGPDALVGDSGSDGLFGGTGSDALLASDGVRSNDAMTGGTGRDRCVGDQGDVKRSCR